MNRDLIRKLSIGALALVTLTGTSCNRTEREATSIGPLELNMGHFPNVTHAQGLIAHHFSRQGKGWFEERLARELGRPVTINWYTYNAGPSAMEALFAGSVDLTYVGPSPAINAFVKSRGAEVRIVAGAAEGGAALVVPSASTAATPADFRGKVIATPQLGNTQDVSCRAWLKEGGLNITLTGGDARIQPTANPEQLRLFQSGALDAVWTVEPWVTRLEQQAGGKVLVNEKDSISTVLVSGADFQRQHPEIVKAIVAAHRELTEWIAAHPEEARKIVVEELAAITRSKVDPALIESAWKRIILTPELHTPLLQEFVEDASHAGFLKQVPDITGLINLPD